MKILLIVDAESNIFNFFLLKEKLYGHLNEFPHEAILFFIFLYQPMTFHLKLISKMILHYFGSL